MTSASSTVIFVAIFAVIGAGVFALAYYAGRARGRHGAWQPFLERPGPLPPPPAEVTPSPGVSTSVRAPIHVVRTMVALSGSLLLLVGCFAPGSLMDKSAFGLGPLMGGIVYGACAVVAALLAATGRFRSLTVPGGIALLTLAYTYWDNDRLMKKFGSDPRWAENMKGVLGIGTAWYVLLAGAIVLFLVGLAGQPSRSGAYAHPPRS